MKVVQVSFGLDSNDKRELKSCIATAEYFIKMVVINTMARGAYRVFEYKGDFDTFMKDNEVVLDAS